MTILWAYGSSDGERGTRLPTTPRAYVCRLMCGAEKRQGGGDFIFFQHTARGSALVDFFAVRLPIKGKLSLARSISL